MITKKDMDKSIEYKWIDKDRSANMIIMLIFFGLALLNHILELNTFMIICLILAFAFLVLTIRNYVNEYKLVKNYERYEKYEGILTDPHVSIRLGLVWYYIVLVIDGKETKKYKTRAMWANGVQKFYCNKKVEVAYDRVKDKVYVIAIEK